MSEIVDRMTYLVMIGKILSRKIKKLFHVPKNSMLCSNTSFLSEYTFLCLNARLRVQKHEHVLDRLFFRTSDFGGIIYAPFFFLCCGKR